MVYVLYVLYGGPATSLLALTNCFHYLEWGLEATAHSTPHMAVFGRCQAANEGPVNANCWLDSCLDKNLEMPSCELFGGGV